MCNPVIGNFASGAVNAIGGAQAAKEENEARKRDYKYKLQVRENRWMRERSTYQTKIAQYDTNLNESNMAAQRAYTQSQINLNNIRSQAMLDHQEDFREFLKTQGDILSSAAERGVTGSTVQRLITRNIGQLGLANAARARALTMTEDKYMQHVKDVQLKNKANNNSLYGKVAISPVPDLPPPPPVMKNVASTLFLGILGAGFDAASAYKPMDTEEN